MSLGVVALLDRFLLEQYGIDAVRVRNREVLTDGGEPGVVYRFSADGVQHFWACGMMRVTGGPVENPVTALYLEACIVRVPESWDTILDLLNRRFPDAGGSKLAIIDEGESLGLGLDLLVELSNQSLNTLESQLWSFMRRIELTRSDLTKMHPNLLLMT